MGTKLTKKGRPTEMTDRASSPKGEASAELVDRLVQALASVLKEHGEKVSDHFGCRDPIQYVLFNKRGFDDAARTEMLKQFETSSIGQSIAESVRVSVVSAVHKSICTAVEKWGRTQLTWRSLLNEPGLCDQVTSFANEYARLLARLRGNGHLTYVIGHIVAQSSQVRHPERAHLASPFALNLWTIERDISPDAIRKITRPFRRGKGRPPDWWRPLADKLVAIWGPIYLGRSKLDAEVHEFRTFLRAIWPLKMGLGTSSSAPAFKPKI